MVRVRLLSLVVLLFIVSCVPQSTAGHLDYVDNNGHNHCWEQVVYNEYTLSLDKIKLSDSMNYKVYSKTLGFKGTTIEYIEANPTFTKDLIVKFNGITSVYQPKEFDNLRTLIVNDTTLNETQIKIALYMVNSNEDLYNRYHAE